MKPDNTGKDPIFILANFTAESLALRLRTSYGLEVRTLPGFDSWRGEFLNTHSPIWKAPSGILYLLLHGPALFPNGIGGDFEATLDELYNLVETAVTRHQDKTFVVSTLCLPSLPAQPPAEWNLARRISRSWRERMEALRIPLLDLEELVADVGRKNFYNAKTWYFGALPFSAQGETLLAEEIMRIKGILNGTRRKCLLLDLDNTLWGGVIGEDGLEGIVLSEDGVGATYRDVQVIVKQLVQQGILLAIVSKNNVEDALLPFQRHPHTILHEDDFVCVRANWLPKPQNVAEIAHKLNIGMDSMVFIDDNPVERATMRAAHPEVAVPEFPFDTALLPAFLHKVANQYFTAPRTEEEDLLKTKMYQAEKHRTISRETYASLDSYLASLKMKIDLHPLREDELSRAAQLCAKTNQFNLTTRRHSETELGAMLHNENCRVWIASLKDRYGDYGRIALAIAELSKTGDAKSAYFDTFLMSCRAMGRGVEDAMLSWIEELLASEGVISLTGRYIPTAKNEPVRDFWARMGYAQDRDLWLLRAPFPERRSLVCRTV